MESDSQPLPPWSCTGLQKQPLPRDAIARIYCPAPSVMQSETTRARQWVLEFPPSTSPFIEPLMGWVGSTDTRHQVVLHFENREQAIRYASDHGLPFCIAEPHKR